VSSPTPVARSRLQTASNQPLPAVTWRSTPPDAHAAFRLRDRREDVDDRHVHGDDDERPGRDVRVRRSHAREEDERGEQQREQIVVLIGVEPAHRPAVRVEHGQEQAHRTAAGAARDDPGEAADDQHEPHVERRRRHRLHGVEPREVRDVEVARAYRAPCGTHCVHTSSARRNSTVRSRTYGRIAATGPNQYRSHALMRASRG
jgi:hypothetical protein